MHDMATWRNFVTTLTKLCFYINNKVNVLINVTSRRARVFIFAVTMQYILHILSACLKP
jgi:hypothetical protein